MQPTVCAIMLTKDRPELAARAVECFMQQTYPRKLRALLVYNTGESDEIECGCNPECFHVYAEDYRGLTIGALRNKANYFFDAYPSQNVSDILIHWDDDDWSHPDRIAEQVEFLQASGADAVGYNEMLFWRTPRVEDLGKVQDPFGPAMLDSGILHPGEAWMYRHPRADRALGTSLCYWRKTWEACPFDDAPKNNEASSEYETWWQRVRVQSKSALVRRGPLNFPDYFDPRMIARIHGANFGKYDIEGLIAQGSREWKRVPEWDSHVKEWLE